MCGIFLVTNPTNQITKIFTEAVANRGPDYQANIEIPRVQAINSERLILGGSVLHIQGKLIIPQPYTDEFGNILLWNGEMFDGDLLLNHNSANNNVECDTLMIARALHSTLSDTLNLYT